MCESVGCSCASAREARRQRRRDEAMLVVDGLRLSGQMDSAISPAASVALLRPETTPGGSVRS